MGAPDGLGVTEGLALPIRSPGLAADYDLPMESTWRLARLPSLDAIRGARTVKPLQSVFVGTGWH